MLMLKVALESGARHEKLDNHLGVQWGVLSSNTATSPKRGPNTPQTDRTESVTHVRQQLGRYLRVQPIEVQQ